MKFSNTIFLILLTAHIAAHAFPDCKAQEAQFKGRISRVEMGRRAENLTCKIFVEADLSKGDLFNPSQICPLDIDELQTSYLYDSTCSVDDYKTGSELSGILVKLNGSNVMYLD